MKKYLLTIGITILLVGPTIASVVGQRTENIGLSDTDFDQKILHYMKLGHMPSLVACIIKNNTIVWSKAYGKYKYYQNKDASLDVIYPIGCITKSFTATAIMQLSEKGLINLDDNVSKYLNFDLKNPKYPDANITFRMLLAHQSSLAAPSERFGFYFFWLKYPMDKFSEYFVPGGKIYSPKIWNNYPPGQGVCYCTPAYNVLGYLIERITGQTLEDYYQKNIFRPLGMMNTSFYFSSFVKSRICGLYTYIGKRYRPLPIIEYGPFAGQGIKSTVLDLSHFLIMHASGGIYNGVRILSKESVEEMHKIQYPGYYDGKVLHGFGWCNTNMSGEEYGGHMGGYVGAPALMRLRYSDNVGIIYLWNQNPYLLNSLGIYRQEEITARQQITEALFEKADEL